MSLFKRSQLAGMNHIFRYYTADDYFKTLQQYGYESAELWTCGAHYLVDSFGFQDARAMAEKARAYGISIICITPEQNCPKPHNLASKDRELIERTYRYFSNAIRAAALMDCPKVLVTSGWAFYSEDIEEAWKRSAEMIWRLCRTAEKEGVSLTMETLRPEESRIVHNIPTMRRMLNLVASKALAVTIDLGAMYVAGESIQDFFDAFPGKINHSHFVDGDPYGHLVWGDGVRNPEEDLEVFHRNGFNGHFTLEYTHSKYLENPKEHMRRSMDVLKPYFEETR